MAQKIMKQKNKITKSPESVAYHEAGHVIAAHRMSIAGFIEKVTILPVNEMTLGGVTTKGQDEYLQAADVRQLLKEELSEDVKRILEENIRDIQRIRRERYTIYLLAGGVAQEKFNPQEFNAGDIEVDRGQVRKQLGGNSEELAHYIPLQEMRTKRLLSDENVWSEVELIANALLERKTLTGAELADLLE